MSDTFVSSVPLTRVTLYKHGIGHFERTGKVKAPGSVELQCGPEEIDDMLKSLLVLKKGGGKISTVTYESSKPLEERLGEFGFDLKNSKDLTDLIGQLKGTPVNVKVGAKEMSGRVVGLDMSRKMTDKVVIEEKYLLVYAEDNVLHRIEVGAISGIEIKDAALAKEVQQQLELLFLAVRKKDRKLLKVDIPGDGENDLIIAYSIPCPIWKTSYRLVFDAEEKLLVQGVAIVDNTQEEDWNDVQMVLVSSSPISFIQPLYEPIMPYRKTIQAQGVKSAGPFVAERAQRMRGESAPAPAQMAAPMAAPGKAKLRGAITPAGGGFSQEMDTGAWGAMDMMSTAESYGSSLADMAEGLDVNASEKGEQFEYKIGSPVSVPRNSSALIPVVQQYIEGERLSLYNETRDADFPYSTVKLKNTTGLTLEAGPVTVMEDDTYAGECLLDVLKPDDTRFLPYALDQSVSILVKNDYDSKPVWRVQVYDGLLYLYHREISRRTYNIENLSSKRKIVYIEHPVQEGYELTSAEKPEETTKNFYRFRIELNEKEDRKLQVDQQRQVTNQYHLDSLDPNWHQIRWLFDQNFSDGKFIEFMKQVQMKRSEIVKLNAELNGLHGKRQNYEQEQQRARENVKTLGASGERFKQAIEQSEDNIIATQQKIDQIQDTLRLKNEELQKFIYTRMEAVIVPSK